MKTQRLKADEMTVTWNNRNLASVMYLAGTEGDGSLWAVSKTLIYSPAPEWTGRHISAYSKSKFNHHWPSGPLFSPCSDSNTESLEWSDFTAEFHWHPSLPMYSAVGFPQLIHQQSHFPCEKWEWERKVNSCINSNPLLGVWKGVVENPSFYSSLLFSLEYAMFCEICSAKRLQRGERKCIGRKERCKVKPEPDKKKKNCLNIGIWIILSEREKGN